MPADTAAIPAMVMADIGSSRTTLARMVAVTGSTMVMSQRRRDRRSDDRQNGGLGDTEALDG